MNPTFIRAIEQCISYIVYYYIRKCVLAQHRSACAQLDRSMPPTPSEGFKPPAEYSDSIRNNNNNKLKIVVSRLYQLRLQKTIGPAYSLQLIFPESSNLDAAVGVATATVLPQHNQFSRGLSLSFLAPAVNQLA